MIFGRDEIEWDGEWGELIDQHCLREFTDEYSKEYLHKVGIDDEKIINSIVNSNKGFPFLLYLSAETYANMKNVGR